MDPSDLIFLPLLVLVGLYLLMERLDALHARAMADTSVAVRIVRRLKP